MDRTCCYEEQWCHGMSRQAGYLGRAAARCLYCRTRVFGDLSRMTQDREQQACPRCSARPAPHGPIHHPRWGQTLFASSHFQKMEKIKAVGVLLNIERTVSLCSAAWERDFVGKLIAFMSREQLPLPPPHSQLCWPSLHLDTFRPSGYKLGQTCYTLSFSCNAHEYLSSAIGT